MDSRISSISMKYLMNINNNQQDDDCRLDLFCNKTLLDETASSILNFNQSDDKTLDFSQFLQNEVENASSDVDNFKPIFRNELFEQVFNVEGQTSHIEMCNVSVQCKEESLMMSHQNLTNLPNREIQSSQIVLQNQKLSNEKQNSSSAHRDDENLEIQKSSSSHNCLKIDDCFNQMENLSSNLQNNNKNQVQSQPVLKSPTNSKKFIYLSQQCEPFQSNDLDKIQNFFLETQNFTLNINQLKKNNEHTHFLQCDEISSMEASRNDENLNFSLHSATAEKEILINEATKTPEKQVFDETYVISKEEIIICGATANNCEQNFVTNSESQISINDNESMINKTSMSDENKSPPIKRRKKVESENFFSFRNKIDFDNEKEGKFFDEHSAMHTGDLFGKSIETTSYAQPMTEICTNQFKLLLTPAYEYSSDNLNCGESCTDLESCVSKDLTNNSSDCIENKETNQKIMNRDVKKVIEKQEVIVNTLYRTEYITKTTENLINAFYDVQEKIDIKDAKTQFDKFMEPSFEYLAFKNNLLPEFIIGEKCTNIVKNEESEDEINDEDPFPNESAEDMMLSFFEKPTCICSTPEKSIEEVNTLDRTFLSLSLDEKSKIDEKTNEIAEETIKNAENVQKFTDELKNESYTEKDVAYSAITHVSCSISTDEDHEFDITRIFNINMNAGSVDKHKNCEMNNEDQEKDENSLFDSRISEDIRMQSLIFAAKSDDSIDQSEKERSIITQNRKAAIMGHIENIIQTLIESLVQEKPLIIKFRKIKDWKDCVMDNDVLSQKITAIAMRTISFSNKNTQRTFTVVTHLLSEIYKMLAKNIFCTKRELYYRDVELMQSQNTVNKAIEVICTILNVQAWELGVLSTSKGLIAGEITIEMEENEVIDCKNVCSVPQNPSAIKSIITKADYVLVVEKDTVFTRLVEENFFEKSLKSCILVTAKGYPDVNTRMFLKRIVSEFNIPIYMIADADPYGIEIMCTYKFGSLELVNNSKQLALSNNMEWIGIHPSDIETLDITYTDMTAADLKKVDELLQRPYINLQLTRELEHMKSRKLKAEIESIYHYSVEYLIQDYIPRKISAINMPMERISQQVCEAKKYSQSE